MSWTSVLPERGVYVTSPWAGPSSFVTFWAWWDLERASNRVFFKNFLIKIHSNKYDLYCNPVHTHTYTNTHACTHSHIQLKGVSWNNTHSYYTWYFIHFFLFYSMSFAECWWWPTTLISQPTFELWAMVCKKHWHNQSSRHHQPFLGSWDSFDDVLPLMPPFEPLGPWKQWPRAVLMPRFLQRQGQPGENLNSVKHYPLSSESP